MNELERRIKVLEYQLKEARTDLDDADDMYIEDVEECRLYNWLLIALVISMVIFSSTKCHHLVL